MRPSDKNSNTSFFYSAVREQLGISLYIKQVRDSLLYILDEVGLNRPQWRLNEEVYDDDDNDVFDDKTN